MLRFRLFRKPCDVCDACRTPPDARHGHFDLDGETSVPLTPEDATAESVSRFWRRLAASCRAARAAWDTIFRFTCCLLRVPRSSRAAPHFLLVPSAGPSDLLPGTGKHLRYRTYRHYAIDQSVKRGMAPKRGTAPPFRTQFSRRGRRRRPRTPARRFFPRARAPRARRVSVLGP